MDTLAAGHVVVIPFPFSDLSHAKLRPALIVAEAGRGDWILCQITSKSYGDVRAVELDHADFDNGSLQVKSYVRPGKIFTANQGLIKKAIGRLKLTKFKQIVKAIVEILESGIPS